MGTTRPSKYFGYIGHKIGSLTILQIKSEGKSVNGECRCDCGTVKWFNMYSVGTGRSKSCGCLQRSVAADMSKKHGMYGTRIYKIWSNMIQRCYNGNSSSSHNYLDRGITVCEKWKDFSGFYEDMKNGYSDTLTLERKDNDLGYCLENCSWETKETQENNKRNNRKITIDGVTRTLMQWSKISGINYSTIRHRMRIGIPEKESIFNSVK